MLEKIVTNIESNTSKAETIETKIVGGRDNSWSNARPTEMEVIITGVGEHPNHIMDEVDEDYQYVIITKGVSTDTE